MNPAKIDVQIIKKNTESNPYTSNNDIILKHNKLYIYMYMSFRKCSTAAP